jgi:truncated hemoglobin YjbI
MHLNAVQEANRQYDSGKLPSMLVDERFDRVYYKDIVDAIFACDNRDDANAIVEYYSKFWMTIIGTRGATGKKTVNAHTKAEEFGIPNVDFSDLRIVKNEEPVVTTFDNLFE